MFIIDSYIKKKYLTGSQTKNYHFPFLNFVTAFLFFQYKFQTLSNFARSLYSYIKLMTFLCYNLLRSIFTRHKKRQTAMAIGMSEPIETKKSTKSV